LRALESSLRFFGSTSIEPTKKAYEHAEYIVGGIEHVLDDIISTGDFVKSMHEGYLGNHEEGAHPGRAGKDTITTKKTK